MSMLNRLMPGCFSIATMSGFSKFHSGWHMAMRSRTATACVSPPSVRALEWVWSSGRARVMSMLPTVSSLACITLTAPLLSNHVSTALKARLRVPMSNASVTVLAGEGRLRS